MQLNLNNTPYYVAVGHSYTAINVGRAAVASVLRCPYLLLLFVLPTPASKHCRGGYMGQRCSNTVGYHKPTTLAKRWHPRNRASWMGHRNIASTHCSTIWCTEAYTQETFRKILARDETPRSAAERGALVPALHTLHGMGYL